MNRATLDAQDRLDTVAVCWSALADLMNPDPHLSGPARDHVAVLMGFLEAEFQAARTALAQAIRSA